MKRKTVIAFALVLSLCMSLLLTSCDSNLCAHDFENACDEMCEMCGFTRVTGHVWKEASCFNPQTCRNCDLTVGEALPHTHDPNCETESVCDNCFALVEVKEHQPDENGVCTICGESVLVTTDIE